MKSDFDLASLSDIPDPFAAAQVSAPGASNATVAQQGASYTELPRAALRASSTRSALRVRRVAAFMAALALESALSMLCGPRPLAELRLPLVAFGVALPLLAATAALGLVSTTLRTRQAAWLVGALATAVFALSCVFASGPGTSALRGMVGCGLCTMALSAVPIAMAVWALRHAFATAVTAKTVALGAACGVFAAAFMRVHCGNDNNWHVLIGHGVAIAVAAMLAGLMGTRITRS